MLKHALSVIGSTVERRLARPAGAVFGLLAVGCAGSQIGATQTDPVHAVAWQVDNLESIGGYRVTVVGDPKVAPGSSGQAVCFDGVDDGLKIGVNPFDRQYGFTIQVLMKPLAGGASLQQVLHVQNADDESRIIVERLPISDDEWMPKVFVRSEDSQLELQPPPVSRPSDRWYWVQATWADGVLYLYLNGEALAERNVAYVPMKAGELSIGMKLSSENFFLGCVQEIRMATAALPAEQLEREPANP